MRSIHLFLFILRLKVAAVGGNKELAELIRNFTDKGIGTAVQLIFISGVV